MGISVQSHHAIPVYAGEKIIEASSKMPANFFVSGAIPALYMHQERAVLEALSRWPVRVLFSDEVGLGKTFEVAATMVYLLKYCGVKRVVILTPKAVLQQWQDELYDNFKIDAWMFDSSQKQYVSATGKLRYMGTSNPLGATSPDIVLMSAQYARGNRGNSGVLERSSTVLPDLLIVDEAHSARVSKGLDGKPHKTRMYSMLQAVSSRIPHMILATATPMQKDVEEYHSILKLLGLPKIWQKKRAYLESLRIISQSEAPSAPDAYSAANLLMKTIKDMAPSLRTLDEDEQSFLQELLKKKDELDQYELGCYAQLHWKELHGAFIKLHPAQLLTVRNTRRSLEQVGYQFPKRNLIEDSITDSMEIQLFYGRVEEYLMYESFSVEQIIMPDFERSIGFVRVSYQQRVASSLYSCKKSLERRLYKVRQVEKYLSNPKDVSLLHAIDLLPGIDFDDIDLDEGQVDQFDPIDGRTHIDKNALERAVGIEIMSLSALLKEANELLEDGWDLKVHESIRLARECLAEGDPVLLFSRYTDTIDALIDDFKRTGDDKNYSYGVYTGKNAAIVSSFGEVKCDKATIKSELFSGRLKLMFCSDAASEGLNLQAARVLINVDVPWTPSRLEQRIGRIARLGQRAKEVDVYNVWYPNSIEAKMYHRIQNRLMQANIAIGEFPEVMANAIKKSVLSGVDEDSRDIQELKDLRNSYQIKSLEALWNTHCDGSTISSLIRKRLIKICDQSFPIVSTCWDEKIKTYQMPDGSKLSYSDVEGIPETISLSSKVWEYIDFANDTTRIVKDANGRYAAFGIKGEQLLKHESILKIPLNEELTAEDLLTEYPVMLPDNARLDLQYAVEGELPSPPKNWID